MGDCGMIKKYRMQRFFLSGNWRGVDANWRDVDAIDLWLCSSAVKFYFGFKSTNDAEFQMQVNGNRPRGRSWVKIEPACPNSVHAQRGEYYALEGIDPCFRRFLNKEAQYATHAWVRAVRK